MSSYTIKHKQRWLLADLVLCSTDGVEYPEERLEYLVKKKILGRAAVKYAVHNLNSTMSNNSRGGTKFEPYKLLVSLDMGK